MKVKLQLAAEQRWEVVCSETTGHVQRETKKLRSSDVDLTIIHSSVAAPQLQCVLFQTPWPRAQLISLSLFLQLFYDIAKFLQFTLQLFVLSP